MLLPSGTRWLVLDDVLAGARRHLDREQGKNDPAGDRDRPARDVQEPHEERAHGEDHQGRHHRRLHHQPAGGAPFLRRHALGFIEERDQCDLRSEPDQQEQQELGDDLDVDAAQIHGLAVPLACMPGATHLYMDARSRNAATPST